MAPRKKAAEKAPASNKEATNTVDTSTETKELPGTDTGTEGTESTTVDSPQGTDTESDESDSTSEKTIVQPGVVLDGTVELAKVVEGADLDAGGSSTSGDASADSSVQLNPGDDKGAEGEDPDPVTDELTVRLSNNSISGHELLRGNGEVVAIVGHGKVTFSTTKEELVAIETQLASKPWVEVHLVDDEAE